MSTKSKYLKHLPIYGTDKKIAKTSYCNCSCRLAIELARLRDMIIDSYLTLGT